MAQCTKCGEGISKGKLCPDCKELVRREKRKGTKIAQIMKDFDISKTAIYDIVNADKPKKDSPNPNIIHVSTPAVANKFEIDQLNQKIKRLEQNRKDLNNTIGLQNAQNARLASKIKDLESKPDSALPEQIYLDTLESYEYILSRVPNYKGYLKLFNARVRDLKKYHDQINH